MADESAAAPLRLVNFVSEEQLIQSKRTRGERVEDETASRDRPLYEIMERFFKPKRFRESSSNDPNISEVVEIQSHVELNVNDIVSDPGLRKSIEEFDISIRDQGLSFRGHDESSNSLNRGNFLELIQWYSQRNEEVSKVVNQNAPENNQMIPPTIQKDLTHACASEITLSIIKDIGNNVFSLMVDESRDISVKEQMGVILRYVNKRGQVIERFLAIVHVSDTSSRSLKDAIDALFVKHGLSLYRLRGQGYDGASNMRGEFNGLKSLILQENPYAREEGWHIIIDKVNTFCELNDIPVPEMKDNCLIGGRSRRRKQVITNLYYYRVEIFYQVVDLVIQEMNTRFSEVSTELLSCLACLHPRNSFSEFNVQKLDPNFSGIEDLGSFAQKIVETLKNQAYPLVYRLIEMTLVLPVATASVERVFSAMKMIKTDLHNRMGDEWMNDSLVVYIEKDIFSTIENEQILQRFQNMKSRRMQLPPLSYPTTT
ncbi:uncharacterized protein LOC122033758 [Zingiber officinale]|uniref:uncharacterized protein LOC122033758 n=1 Tax=Zingiber officinale TaxID=94328 RepID=UPI001C4AB8FD|nr:uncharacterized protein LOC122033758 [Zingiber officinale]